jgi:hypothetical protein
MVHLASPITSWMVLLPLLAYVSLSCCFSHIIIAIPVRNPCPNEVYTIKSKSEGGVGFNEIRITDLYSAFGPEWFLP